MVCAGYVELRPVYILGVGIGTLELYSPGVEILEGRNKEIQVGQVAGGGQTRKSIPDYHLQNMESHSSKIDTKSDQKPHGGVNWG